jgi:hypothetical protein
MQKKWLKDFLPHAIAVLVFLLVAAIYCRPVLEGKVLHQEDVTQWKAMAHNSIQYQEQHGKMPLWTEGMFSGMPGFQIDMDARVIAPQYYLFQVVTLYLAKPMNFFFLACICFYFLSQVLRVNPYIGMVTALAYAYATYNSLIIVAGHDTKMQCIALLPAFIGSVILLYEKKYLWGTALTAICTAQLVAFDHLQIFYYGLIIAGIMTIGYIIQWVSRKEYKHLLIAGVLVAASGMIGVLSNAVLIFTTYDYARATIRGGTELAVDQGSYTKTGLSKEYAFSYSMYKTEPFVLLVPKMFGGSSGLETPEESSKAVEALQAMPPELGRQLSPYLGSYWGGIGTASGPNTSGPPYAGAVICFLAILGMFVLDNKHKWWITATCLLAFMMSWGGYFAEFNGWLLKFLPGYNKFRAPSVIIVIPELLLCMLAALSMQKIWSGIRSPAPGNSATGSLSSENAALWKEYKKGLILMAGIFAVLLLFYVNVDYVTTQDRELLKRAGTAGGQAVEYVKNFQRGLKEDRQGLFFDSLIRSLLFVTGAGLVLGLYIKRKINGAVFIGVLGLLSFIDLMGTNVKYLNSDSYHDETELAGGTAPTAADQQIMKDTGYYRVFDLRNGASQALTYGAMTAAFHRSIGGYHPAKLSIYEDLIENQLYKFPDCRPVVNMLNTKYFIHRDAEGKEIVLPNPEALGTAWFVKAIHFEPNARSVMDALTGFHPGDTAIVFEADRKLVKVDTVNGELPMRVSMDTKAGIDSITRSGAGPGKSGHIELVKNDNDEMLYQSVSPDSRFAVFSEVFYNRGWKAYIDNPSGETDPRKEVPIIRTNYVLRGVSVPAGEHTIRFVFHPDSYYTGQLVQRVAASLLTLILLGAVVVEVMRRRRHVRANTGGKEVK